MPFGKTLIVSLIATALLGTVAAAVAFAPAPAAVVAPASAAPDAPRDEGEMEFMMGARATISLGFRLEETSDVRIRLVLTRGETTDLFMDGPGDCDNVLRGVNVGDGRSATITCADLPPGDHTVELTHKAGTVWGRLSATPMDDEAAVEVIEGDGATTASVTAPYPTCPLECSVSYAWGSADMPDFEVRDGATRVVVTATWDARHPADALRIGLSRLVEEDDGARIYEGVAGDEGVGSVTFETAALEAGTYGVSAWQAAPAGADALRVVHYVVEVHYG